MADGNADNQSEIYMKANSVDQLNVNHQSNMTLSAHSSITQTHYIVEFSDIFAESGDD